MRTVGTLPLVALMLISFRSTSQCSVDAGIDVTLYMGYPPMECATLTANATGVVPFTYLWSTGDTTQSITVCDTANATYTVVIVDSAGCTATDVVSVTVVDVSCPPNKVLVCHIPPGNPANAHTICISANAVPAHLAHGCTLGACDTIAPPGCSVDLGPDFTVCPGDTATLDAGAGFVTYAWSDGTAGQTHEVTTPGTYAVTVTDSAGCTADDEVVVDDNTNPLLDLGPDTTVCAGDTLILDAGAGFATYMWSDSSTAQTLVVDTVGVYWVSVTDSSGCSATDTVVVDDCDSLTFGGPRYGVHIYPNPTPGIVLVNYKLTEPDYVTISIYSASGKLVRTVFEGYSLGNGHIGGVDLTELPHGLYVATIRTSSGLHHQKFLKLD